MIAFLAGLAGLAVAAESAVIYLLGGGALPGVTPANALMSPIAAELLLVFLGLVIAVFEFGRFATLRRVAGKT